jgi:hypothetical protein
MQDFCRRSRKGQPIKPPERFQDVRRNGDLLRFHVAGTPLLAKASLSRLFQEFQNEVDFVILTSYRPNIPERQATNTFDKFPAEYRSLVGTKKIRTYQLVGHWQEQGAEEELERSWFVINVDPNLSGEDFIAAAQALAAQYEQTALIVSRQGVTTLETPEGRVFNTLTTAGAIENATLKLRKARDEFEKGEREDDGYSELKRTEDRGREGQFMLDAVPDAPADQGTAKEGSNAYLFQPCVFVIVPGSNSARWVFSILGINYPHWSILEK